MKIKPVKFTLLASFLTISITVIVIVVGQIISGREQGLEFSGYRTQQQCFEAVLTGPQVCKDKFSCYFRGQSFLGTCLDNTRQSADFCSSLPSSFGNLLAVEIWKKRRCDQLDRTDRTCHRIQLEMLNRCDTD